MKKLILGLSLFCSFAIAGQDAFKKINVADMESMVKTSKPEEVFVYDANTESTRKKEGIIPGAKLLNSISSYDVKELPANKDAKLIFYCANVQCTASHKAAKRAIDSGFKNVNVLTDGIEGWKKAGKPTSNI